jgi:hypothetical protein
MAGIIHPTRKGIREFVSAAVNGACRDYESEAVFSRLIIPYDVNCYITNLVIDTFFDPMPDDLDGTMNQLMNRLPKDRVERYERFKQMGDIVLCFRCINGINLDNVSICRCQEFYCDAHNIGEKIQEPHAPVLGTIAEKIYHYLPVLERIPKHLRKSA